MKICFTTLHLFEKASDLFLVGDFMERVEESLEVFEQAIVIGFIHNKAKAQNLHYNRAKIFLYPKFNSTIFPFKIVTAIIYMFVTFVLLAIRSITEKIEIINVGDTSLSGLPAMFNVKLFRQKLIIFLQGSEVDSLKYNISVLWQKSRILRFFGAILNVIQVWICRNADIIVTVSNSLGKNLVDKYYKKPLWIPNGVDINKFHPQHITEIREKLGLGGNFVILYAGRLSKEKGVCILPIVLYKVIKLIPSAHLLVVGEGDLKEILNKAFTKLGIKNSVTLMGPIAHKDMPKIINSADILVLFSFTEGLPLILQEALACGKPVVATNVGGVHEIVKDGWNGLLVEQGSINKMVEAIYFLYKNPGIRIKYGLNGLLLVKLNFSREVSRKKFIRCYSLLMKNRNR
jgi:glycosyltransferase involved in cell wall biosynthesis